MQMFKKLLSLVSAAALITTSLNLSAFAEASVTDSDIHFGACVSEDGVSEYGYVGHKIIDEDGNEIEFDLKSDSAASLKGTLPAKYSLVDKGYLPAVRNQGSEGTCWAHAGMAMAESNMIMQGLASKSTVDYSEKHLAWFAIGASAPEGDPLYGDFSGLGADVAYNNGGNIVDVMYTLMAWIGVEQESAVPYRDFANGVAESYRYHSYAHLQNVNEYDSSDMDSIKSAIMRDGAVQISYYANNNFLTTSNSAGFAAYYCPTAYTTNHSITVVGWDDNFSKSNFTKGGTPSSNGAWLCRNSWGSTWGTNGYFYMSYEDATVGEFASLTMEPATNYGKVYQYDGGCYHNASTGRIYYYRYIYGSSITGAANVFTASANDELTAVSYYTPAAGWNYTIKIYNNLKGNTPNTGTLVSAATVSGTADYAGYHTVKLPTNVAITKGRKFAVSVDLWDPSTGRHYVVTDMNNHSDGLSYFCNVGTWNDCTDYYDTYQISNIRVKAYTKASAPTAPQNVKAVPGDGKVTVSWDKVSGATKYAVYIYQNGEYTLLSNSITGTSYTKTGLTNGTKYGFKVKAYAGSWSGASDAVYATPVNPVPTGLTAAAGDASAALTWNKVSGATKYSVYLYKDGVYTCLNSAITTNSYTATGLTNNKKVGFKVKAYVGDWSAASDMVYVTPSASAIVPTNLRIANGNGKVRVLWDKVVGATKYAVYSYLDGKYTTETTSVTATNYTVTGLTNGTKYGFKVKAYVNGKWSAASAIIYARPSASTAPGAIKAIAGNKSAEVKWSGVIGATKYAVYKYENGVYTCVNSNITDIKYTVTGLTNGKQYGFKVKAYVNGAWSAASVIAYATPTA